MLEAAGYLIAIFALVFLFQNPMMLLGLLAGFAVFGLFTFWLFGGFLKN